MSFIRWDHVALGVFVGVAALLTLSKIVSAIMSLL